MKVYDRYSALERARDVLLTSSRLGVVGDDEACPDDFARRCLEDLEEDGYIGVLVEAARAQKLPREMIVGSMLSQLPIPTPVYEEKLRELMGPAGDVVQRATMLFAFASQINQMTTGMTKQYAAQAFAQLVSALFNDVFASRARVAICFTGLAARGTRTVPRDPAWSFIMDTFWKRFRTLPPDRNVRLMVSVSTDNRRCLGDDQSCQCLLGVVSEEEKTRALVEVGVPVDEDPRWGQWLGEGYCTYDLLRDFLSGWEARVTRTNRETDV